MAWPKLELELEPKQVRELVDRYLEDAPADERTRLALKLFSRRDYDDGIFDAPHAISKIVAQVTEECCLPKGYIKKEIKS